MEKQIIEHAIIFLSIPMTLQELSKRTAIKEEELLKEFNNKLYLIDESLAIKVRKVLKFLENYSSMIS